MLIAILSQAMCGKQHLNVISRMLSSASE